MSDTAPSTALVANTNSVDPKFPSSQKAICPNTNHSSSIDETEVRPHKVAAAKAKLTSGEYERPEVVDAAIDKMIDQLPRT